MEGEEKEEEEVVQTSDMYERMLSPKNTKSIQQIQKKPGVTKQEKVHRFTLKISPAVMETKGNNVQQILKVMTRTIDKRTGYTAVFHPTTKLSLATKPIANISEKLSFLAGRSKRLLLRTRNQCN